MYLGYKEAGRGILPFFEGFRGTEFTIVPRGIPSTIGGIPS